MNIYAEEGTKVKYTGQGGYESDLTYASQYLKVGSIYIVEQTKIGNWNTDVLLKGFGNRRFNSVHFEDV